MPDQLALSDEAIALLRRHAVDDDVRVTDENREAHRELARADLMVVGHSFRDGREAFYRLTKIGRKIATAPWLVESSAPRP